MADTTIQPLEYFLRNVGIIWYWIFADEADRGAGKACWGFYLFQKKTVLKFV